MPIETPPPKYAVIVNALQARISAGAYAVGSMLPSEAELAREFSASRSTVVKALEFLRQRGWIEAQQGRGRTVLGPPRPAVPSMPQRIHAALTDSERAVGVLLAAAPLPAPPRVAAALHLPDSSTVVARRLLVRAEAGPTELRTTYLPAALAAVVGLAGREPLHDGLLSHLGRHGTAAADHVREQLCARQPTRQEASLLAIGPRDCLLTALWSVHDRAGRPLLAIDAALPAIRRVLEGSFPMA